MTALLPWSATMIAPNEDFNGAPLLRKEFALAGGHGIPVKAILRATSFGVFEASINGRPVGEDVLSPGWSSYEWRLRYRSYDVTALAGARQCHRRRPWQRLVPGQLVLERQLSILRI